MIGESICFENAEPIPDAHPILTLADDSASESPSPLVLCVAPSFVDSNNCEAVPSLLLRSLI